MRYIGGKSLLLEEIHNFIKEATDNVQRVIDIFSGSGVVADYLKQQGYHVIGNDMMYFSYVLSRGTTALNQMPLFENLEEKNPIEYLNRITLSDVEASLEDCFIYRNYAPHDGNKRMYFQPENALKIDLIRIKIEEWKEKGCINADEYYYLLAALLAAIPYVSNIAGVYGAYLKHWDARTYNPLQLVAPPVQNIASGVFYNRNCDDLLPEITGDLLYADPPYNSRQYLPNYHILETVARYDYPEIHGVTGMRNYQEQKSDFCMKGKVEAAFRRMIENSNVSYILISYNNEGLLSTRQLSEICREYAAGDSFQLREISYRRYKNGGREKPNQGVMEQLYFFQKQHRRMR